MVSFLIDWLFDNVVTNLSLIAIFTIFYYYSTSTYDKWRKLNVPYIPPLPLFGNMFRMIMRLDHMTEMFDRLYYQFPDEKLIGIYQMREAILMVRDPELIYTILVKDFSYFTDHGFNFDSTSVLSKSLFLANGQKWRTMRQKLSPGFTSGKLKDTYIQIDECSNEMVSVIEKKLGETDRMEVKTMTADFATDVIGTCAFGLKLDTIKSDDSDFRRYLKMIFANTPKQIIVQVMLMIWPWVIKVLKIQLFSAEATDFFYKVFTDVIKYREEHNVARNDLTQTLMQARKELVLKANPTTEDDKFTDDDIIGNAIVMFTAGTDTVSSTLAFCMYELALNKEIQDKLRAEILSMKAKHNGQLNNDYLVDLHYTNMVLEETARKYSVAFSLIRVATKTYTLPDESLVIEKGQKLVIPMFSIHRDPKYYPDPMSFDPERFSMEQKSQRPNGTYIPFGDGPRVCIGKRFAESEMKLVLSNVLSKFEVLPCEQTEIPLDIKQGTGFITPKNGAVLKFRKIIQH